MSKTKTSEVQVVELDELIVKIFELEDAIEAKDAEKAEISKEKIKLEALVVQHLKDLDRKEYDSPNGKVVIDEKWRVNNPQTDQDKALLFAHLQERGIFNKYASVNSASLNSLYNADWEAAKQQGMGLEFSMPGIGAPQLFEKPKFKESKAYKAKKALGQV